MSIGPLPSYKFGTCPGGSDSPWTVTERTSTPTAELGPFEYPARIESSPSPTLVFDPSRRGSIALGQIPRLARTGLTLGGPLIRSPTLVLSSPPDMPSSPDMVYLPPRVSTGGALAFSHSALPTRIPPSLLARRRSVPVNTHSLRALAAGTGISAINATGTNPNTTSPGTDRRRRDVKVTNTYPARPDLMTRASYATSTSSIVLDTPTTSEVDELEVEIAGQGLVVGLDVDEKVKG